MTCKNVECDNKTENNRKYCSLTCRNIYVNKYLRDYKKLKETNKKKKKEKENEYLKNPKKCEKCEIIIPFNKKENKFCSKSCSVSFNNSIKEHTTTTKMKISESINKYIEENGIFGCLKGNKIRICKQCNKKHNLRRKYCSDRCLKEYKRRNMTEYQKYKSDSLFKFNLADYSDEFDFSLIRKYGWYSPTNKNNNLNGVSRDHIFSVKEGFELKIDPLLLAHPANCRLMIHNDNISKNKKSDITYEELLKRIEVFEKKYGKY